MENPPAAATGVRVRGEPSIDPVKAQGILATVNKKEKYAAHLWEQRWKFFCHIPELEEEEAQKMGMTREEYRAAVRSLNSKPKRNRPTVPVEASTTPLPLTSLGMLGRRVGFPLEKYGRLVKTGCDYPTRPPLPPGQIYDPYKQTLMFLGSVEGDPISYKLSQTRSDVTDEMWAETKHLDLALFNFDKLLE